MEEGPTREFGGCRPMLNLLHTHICTHLSRMCLLAGGVVGGQTLA